jgi:hypothetical protein
MWVQHDLTLKLANTEIAETSTAVDLTGSANGSIVSAHDIPDL